MSVFSHILAAEASDIRISSQKKQRICGKKSLAPQGYNLGWDTDICYTVAMRLFAKQSQKPPWYAGGLAFECMGCGGCCAGPEEGYVWVKDKEIDAIAAHLNMPVDEMRRRYVRRVGRRQSLIECSPSGDCVFLESDEQGKRQCRVYPVRPAQCRTWPFWAQNVSSPYHWSEAARRCPGINRGSRLHRQEEIETNVRATQE